jgi:hypothetical protein
MVHLRYSNFLRLLLSARTAQLLWVLIITTGFGLIQGVPPALVGLPCSVYEAQPCADPIAECVPDPLYAGDFSCLCPPDFVTDLQNRLCFKRPLLPGDECNPAWTPCEPSSPPPNCDNSWTACEDVPLTSCHPVCIWVDICKF